jgi:hypothetical protein
LPQKPERAFAFQSEPDAKNRPAVKGFSANQIASIVTDEKIPIYLDKEFPSFKYTITSAQERSIHIGAVSIWVTVVKR